MKQFTLQKFILGEWIDLAKTNTLLETLKILKAIKISNNGNNKKEFRILKGELR